MFLPPLLRQLKFCLWKPIFESKIYISNIQFSEYSLLQLTWQRTKIDRGLRIIDCYMEKNPTIIDEISKYKQVGCLKLDICQTRYVGTFRDL